ncbi:TonB-dependent receptor [Riemerella columbipharyngis]|uniref:Iron complex outermembrane recepter protein n=1 Tax=Riemerella columbipharyngis TaxID=1071918 RepID=A0A1G7A612_9FLAO|nr:TonB-dependent receptor [Riemerella columbipharyngis]SDE09917.1 iron complex outermembrane recepter protein [Riemerella columbipharyngis]
MKGFVFSGLFVSSLCLAQQMPKDSTRTTDVEEIKLLKRLPVSKEIINVDKDLKSKNLGQDLPILLRNQMSVITTSDAGNGVGYTGFRIRGTAGTSINVIMNGVPYNDSESQGTFFVDVPDLVSSASQVVIQRGVGTSSNGVSAFGASVNVISKEPSKKFYVKTDDSYGSFNTYKYSAEVGSGQFLDNQLFIMARYTKIHSDGYIDRAFSNLDSYNVTALFQRNQTMLRLMAFGGKEKTYQAWNGIDAETMATNRKANSCGAIYNEDWSKIIGYYDNETDNYRQNHYQFLWKQELNNDWRLETTLHYTKGKGYYRNYKQDKKFSKYNLPNLVVNGNEVKRDDFIRDKWLNNDFYGLVSTLYGHLENMELNFGLVANQYYGRHYGNVSGVKFKNIVEHEYYRNRSLKNEVSGFAKAVLKLNKWNLFGDLQLRKISYDTKILTAGDDEGLDLDKQWNFFNPKVGVSHRLKNGKVYFSFAVANREPNRDTFKNNIDAKQEKLYDWELGLEKSWEDISFTANAYYMDYKNQLVYSGVINDVGDFVQMNVPESHRMGIELGTEAVLSSSLRLTANATLSQNKIKHLEAQDENKKTIVLSNTDIALSPNFIGNLGLQYQPFKNFELGITQQFIGKQYLDNTQNKNYKLRDYALTDFNAKYTLNLHRTSIDFNLLVNNLFDKSYVSNGYVYGTTPYYFAQAGTNFMFGVSVKFE